MKIDKKLLENLVVLIDSFHLSKKLQEVTDFTLTNVDVIAHKNDSEQVKSLEVGNGKLYLVDQIDYEQYKEPIKTIKNKHGSIDAIVVLSTNEELIGIAAKLRTEFNVPIGTRTTGTTSLTNESEMKKRPIKGRGCNSNGHSIEQSIDEETYTVNGIVGKEKVQFFVVFQDYPSSSENDNTTLSMAQILVENSQILSDIETICNAAIEESVYANGTFHLQLVKNRIDGRFSLLSITTRPDHGAIGKLMAKFGVDLLIEKIRIDSGLQSREVQLPKATSMGVVTVRTPDRNRSPVFDSVNLPEKLKYQTLIGIEAPEAGQVMHEDDTVNVYFASTDEALVKAEIDRCQKTFQITYQSKASAVNGLIDLRSDTFTLQTEGMKNAMVSASVGDVAYGEDATVNQLEEYCALLFGKEQALFIATGTMTNQIAIKAHTQPGDEVVTDNSYHINFYESSQSAALGAVTLNLTHAKRGLMTVNDIHNAIDSKQRGFMYASPVLIFLENTVNACGGSAYPMEQLKAIKEYADRNGLRVHMDGARCLNACITMNSRPCDLAAYTDSISLCFSKALGAPFGSVIAGTRDFIEKVKVYRKWFGGTLHQGGYMAAAALYALNENWETIIKRDHDHAKLIEDQLLTVLPRKQMDKVDTNIVIVDLDGVTNDKAALLDALKQKGVLGLSWNGNKIRFVTCRNISKQKAITAAAIIKDVLESFVRNR